MEVWGAKIILEMPAALLDLAATLKGSFQLIAEGSPLPKHDLHCPLISLPLVFGTRVDSIPADIPYLFADPEKRRLWQKRLGTKRRPRVGLAWSGSTLNRNNHNRLIPLGTMESLWPIDVEYHALQKMIGPEEKKLLTRHGIAFHDDVLENFSDTAALIAEMDLVVSVDTSVAHAAGALGKPLWVLLPFAPDYRWMREREDSPWYPTARLLRQSGSGDWTNVVARLEKDLKEYAGKPPEGN
jgi:hypothetical protein